MKKISIDEYLRPRASGDAADFDRESRPQRDPTYSVLLGYGFRKHPKPAPSDLRADEKGR